MKRGAPLTRKTPLRARARISQPHAGPGEGTCAHCAQPFLRLRPLQAVCSPICARRKVEADKKAERESDRQRRQAIQSIPELIAEADREFAAWVRERDRAAGLPCISSGRPLDWSGNQVDAGHYRSRGAASHLRYHPDNCHAQSKYENRHRAGNAVEYRIRLIERIGLARVEALEADNTPHKWTKEELRSIAAHYRAEARRLRKQRSEE